MEVKRLAVQVLLRQTFAAVPRKSKQKEEDCENARCDGHNGYIIQAAEATE